MSSTCSPLHPKEFHSPGWHYEAGTPIVDGKYYDGKTGELVTTSPDDGHEEYSGPPAVDIVIKNLHADTTECVTRAARSFPVEVLLYQVVRVVRDRGLKIDSLMVTPYAIRVILAHELTVEGFVEVGREMINGVWDGKEG